MNPKNILNIETLTKTQSFHFFVIFAALVTLVYSIFEAVNDTVLGYWKLASYGTLAIFVIIWAWKHNKRYRNKTVPLKRDYFHPFENLDGTKAWNRSEESEALIERIKSSDHQPILIVGESGVGKSVIVSTSILPHYMKGNWDTISMNEYKDFRIDILNELKKYSKSIKIESNGNVTDFNLKKKLLLVFDQFEQYLLGNSKPEIGDTENGDWFRNFINSIKSDPHIKVLIIIRNEWYYDLTKIIPSPINCFPLNGIEIDNTNLAFRDFKKALQKVIKNDDTIKMIIGSLNVNNEISPMEAQLVGCMLENKNDVKDGITEHKFTKVIGGKEGLIEEFFEITLKASPNKELAVMVLFALSIEIKTRRQLTKDQLVKIIHRPKYEISECLEFLIKEKLIINNTSNQFELCHDYLAEKFHEISGVELEPKARDNILCFGDELHKAKGSHVDFSEEIPKKFQVVSDSYLTALILLIILRLFLPLFNIQYSPIYPVIYFDKKIGIIDFYYLPVFISHIAWSYYVNTFYKRFFSLLNEENFGKFFSGLTLIACFLAVSCALFVPNCFILSIGFGGLFVGIKLIQLAYVKNLSKNSKKEFKEMGWQTVCNSSIAIIGGYLFTSYFFHSKDLPADLLVRYLSISLPSAAFLTYACYIVARKHIIATSTATWLGIFDRRQNR